MLEDRVKELELKKDLVPAILDRDSGGEQFSRSAISKAREKIEQGDESNIAKVQWIKYFFSNNC